MDQILRAACVVPVIRGESSLAQARRLLDSGRHVIELTANSPDWENSLQALRQDYPQATLGVGTVTTAPVALAAMNSGADFLVSPWPTEAVRHVARVPFIEGGFTPGEVAAAASRGIAKLFPAHVGGPAYLRTLLAVLPGALIMPTGGVKLSEVQEWLDAGAVAVGINAERVLADQA